MTDSPNPPDCTAVLKQLQHGPLSALELARALRCSIKQVLEHVHACWFQVVPIAGDWPGWKYTPRVVLGKSIKHSQPQPFVGHDAASTAVANLTTVLRKP